MAKSLYSSLLKRFGTLPGGRQKRQFAALQQNRLNTRLETLRAPLAPEVSKKIVIVGGGFAGMSAAYYLALQKHQVTVCEADSRLGGRVFSNRDDFTKGQIIEFGAELIGSNHPQWVKLAKEFGLSFDVVTSEDLFDGAKLVAPTVINNKPVSEEDAERLFNNMNIVYNQLTEEAKALGDDWERPWVVADAEKLDGISLKAWFDAKVEQMHLPDKDKELLLGALNADFANNNAVPCEKQSLLGILALVQAGGGDLYWSMTEVYRCSHGNDALAAKMAEVVGKENIHLNSAVTQIDLNDDGVTVHRADGKQVHADYVILATPPTTWSAIRMDEAIRKRISQTGNALKYMSSVKDRFWIKNGVAPSGLGGKVGMTWEGSDNQAQLPGKTFGLSCFAGAEFADEIMKTDSKNIKAFFDPELEAIFEGYSASFIDYHYQCWPLKPFTKTGYSFPGINQVCNQIKLLNEPYKRMYFAGEHACAGFWGYMEGALRSGMLAAERIQKAITG